MKVEAVFEVQSVEMARNSAKGAVVLRGTLYSLDGREVDGIWGGAVDVPLVVHTEDGQPPVKLGAKLKVTFTDEGL